MTASARPWHAQGAWLLDVVQAGAPEVVEALPDAVFRSRRATRGIATRPERRPAHSRAEALASREQDRALR